MIAPAAVQSLSPMLRMLVFRIDDLLAQPGLIGPARYERLGAVLAPFVADGSWIPRALTLPALRGYRRELLYEDPAGAYAIGVFVWAPGERSVIHDHHAWSVMGNITGVLRSETFVPLGGEFALLREGADELLGAGETSWSAPESGDVHRVSAATGEPSVSIHVYGCRFDAVNRNVYRETPS